MEKVLYVLWRDPAIDRETFSKRLRTDIAGRLLDQKVHGLQVNVNDDAVAAGDGIYYVHTRPQMEALLHVWVDCSIPRFRKPIDDIVAQAGGRWEAFLTTEAYPLLDANPVPVGERSNGWAQIGFGKRREDMPYLEWIAQWQRHTEVALTHQTIWCYQQSEFVRPLTPNAPDYSTMVEESFPIEALTDPKVFFGAPGDEEKYQHNFKAMMDSVMAFADLSAADVFPTSKYVIKPVDPR
jgi:hypothetical protein